MYQYSYERIEVDRGFFSVKLDEHRNVINLYAKDGWRFVAAIPVKFGAYGAITGFDLVFEKEVEK